MQAIAFARRMPCVSDLTLRYTLNGHLQVLIGRLCIQASDMYDEESLISDQACAGIDRSSVDEDDYQRNKEEGQPN